MPNGHTISNLTKVQNLTDNINVSQPVNLDQTELNIATNFSNVKKGGRAVDSDHYTQVLKVQLEMCPMSQKRQEIYNLKTYNAKRHFEN